MKGFLSKLLSVTLAVVMVATAVNVTIAKFDGEKKVKASVYDEIKMPNIGKKELKKIADSALTDGVKTAKLVNGYANNADYEAALNKALTSYYKTENFKELEKFKEGLDERAEKIVLGYQKAAKERKAGDIKNGYRVGQIITKFDKSVSEDEIKAIAKAEYGKVSSIYKDMNGDSIVQMDISLGQTVDMAADEYKEYSITEIAEENTLASASYSTRYGATNDTSLSNQWYLDTIHAVDAWNVVNKTAHSKVKVGIIDSGVDYTHDELKEYITDDSANIIGSTQLLKKCDNPYNMYHGTSVSGCVTAKANNSRQIAGTASAYDNSIVSICGIMASYLYENGNCWFTAYDEAKAIDYCVAHDCDIINMSLGGDGSSSIVSSSINNALSKNVIVVCSAGNKATAVPQYPASYDGVINVASVSVSEKLATSSSFGSTVDICAPGDSVLTTYLNNTTAYCYGTSFASPVCAGVIAMMRSINPELTADEAVKLMQKSATPLADADSRSKVNYGIVNAAECVAEVAGLEGYKNCVKDTNVSLGAWNYYVGSWAGASAEYFGGEELDSFGIKVLTNNKSDWGVQAYTKLLDTDFGAEYNYTIKVKSNKAGAPVLFKDDTSNVNIETKTLSAGENVFKGTFKSKTNKIKLFFDLSKLDAGTEFEITEFSMNKIGEAATTKVPVTTTQTPVTTTSKAAVTTTQAATQGQTTKEYNPNVPEVIGLNAYCQSNNTIAVVWGQDAERINKGCRYNVYVDGQVKLGNAICNFYTINGISAGTHTVTVKATLDGYESKGVSLTVNVTGNQITTTQVPVTTTTKAVVTTAAPTTTQAQTTQVQTTEKETIHNLAIGKKAYASSEESDQYKAQNAIDGNKNTRWSSAWKDGESITIDLGETCIINDVKIDWEAAYAEYFTVSWSNDGVNFTGAATVHQHNATEQSYVYFYQRPVRYIKITCDQRATSYGSSIYEIQVNGVHQKKTEEVTTQPVTTEAPTTTQAPTEPEVHNISQGKRTVASSEENSSYKASYATDGDMNTRWSSGWTDNQWIYVDLGKKMYIERVDYKWEAAYAACFEMYVSDDGVTWDLLTRYRNYGLSCSNYVFRSARYIKMQGISRATEYGYSLYEMNVMGY